ncbi:hypothetical protein IJ096_01655 [Candidatus Saccharibacteria bacterium]|nr:hypothetical protein [Candidatus Saccharibacteria bacterium]
MIKIGENVEPIKKLQTELHENERQVAELNKRIAEIEDSICKLEKPKLPIKVFLANRRPSCAYVQLLF